MAYATKDLPCPGIRTDIYYLIGGGTAETVLLFLNFYLLYRKYERTYDKRRTTTTTVNPNGTVAQKSDRLWYQNCLYIVILTVFIGAVAFFAVGHEVYDVRDQLQFPDRSRSPFCEQVLFNVNFGLIILRSEGDFRLFLNRIKRP
jgi:hypothetical protein